MDTLYELKIEAWNDLYDSADDIRYNFMKLDDCIRFAIDRIETKKDTILDIEISVCKKHKNGDFVYHNKLTLYDILKYMTNAEEVEE